jgi:CHAT domain-containing protein
MLGLLDGQGFVDPASRQTVFAYSHPIFWAPFSLVGDGGGNTRSIAEAK